MNNSPCRKPAGKYMIESAPQYRQYLAAKAAREIVERILSPLSAALGGYQSELRQMLEAPVYFGPGR